MDRIDSYALNDAIRRWLKEDPEYRTPGKERAYELGLTPVAFYQRVSRIRRRPQPQRRKTG